MKDSIAGTDVGQEGVPQTLARVRSFHQASNIYNIKEGWDFAETQKKKKKKKAYY